MKAKLQILLATVALTVLIWVYADQQGWRTVKFPVAVRVTTLPEVVATVDGATEQDEPATLHVSVIARGPNATIRDLNLNRPPVFEVTIPVTENMTTDAPRIVDIHDPVALATREHGLQLLTVNPVSITVKFDRRVKLPLEVQADAGAFSEALKGSLSIDPAAVTATVLNSELSKAPPAAEQRLVIPIEDELRSQPGQDEFEFAVSLKNRKWQGMNVKWEPETIRISGKLKQQYENLELKLIPLRVLLPWDWPCDKYQVVWMDERDRLQKVQLKVPVGKPTVLTNTDVTAYVAIDGSMVPPEPPPGSEALPATQPAAEPSPFSQAARFVFPPGFEDVKVVSPPAMIKFRIVKREQTEDGVKTDAATR
jgi:hypothetical protein